MYCMRENIFSKKEIYKTSSAILYVLNMNRMQEEIFPEEEINKTYNVDRIQLSRHDIISARGVKMKWIAKFIICIGKVEINNGENSFLLLTKMFSEVVLNSELFSLSSLCLQFLQTYPGSSFFFSFLTFFLPKLWR